MPPKKNKGTKIDLSTLGVSTMPGIAALPKGPQERAADDEGRFRRAFPGDDRGGGKGGGMSGGGGDFGRSDGEGAWGRSGGGSSFGGDRGMGGGFGSDRGGGMGGGGERPRLNLSARGASGPGGAPAPPSGGGLGGRFSGMAPPPAASSGGGRFGFVDGDRAADGGGRFGNGGGDDNGRFSRPTDGGSGGGATPVNYSAAAQQPTAFTGGRVPGSEVGGTAAQVVLAKVAEDAKEKAKAEGKQQRNAAKKAAKEAEEAAKAAEKEAKKAAKQAAKEQAEKDAASAASLLKSGKKGEALVAAATALGAEMPSARAVTACVLAGLSEPTSTEWCTEEEYGACLKALCSGKASTDKAAGILIACQLHYAKLSFPKAEPKEKGQRKLPYFETLLYKLYDAEVVEEVSVNAWRYADDDEKSEEAVGKTDALFNLSEFLKWLDEPPAEEESEEEEVLEVVNVALKSK